MISFARRTVAAGMLFFAFVSFWPALKKDHSGLAKVIDAGAIEINGERHHLYGLHAVELGQTCRRRDGSAWPCGKEAAKALARFVDGRKVMCEPHGRDDRGQYLSICYAERDGINAWVTGEGWAAADPDAPRMWNFASEESMARFLRRGVWSAEVARRK
ncbi:MAG: thermonuclease family protein [Alphaproteobacteria bacterium]|nr:thermonuclease family protein [Alphaproteobacteria bacterium]MBM3655130.1 thermonuclease family protein [Alphaproteobacteria bacterium]